jgi:deoxyribose-phosphate aldolase
MSSSAAEQARRALTLLDLTELGDAATVADVDALCDRAVTPFGRVAAVCVWPRFVAQAAAAVAGTGVRVATVVNFPSGTEALDEVVAQTDAALADGADEIDLVLPYRALVNGRSDAASAMVVAIRSVVPQRDHLLKVILETGELPDARTIDSAARLAIRSGADFVKTSTGKTPVSATLEATGIMLAAIRDLDPMVGLKPSGGIRTLADADAYLHQADEVMGPRWVSPSTFRFGASGLLNALLAELEGGPAEPGEGY